MNLLIVNDEELTAELIKEMVDWTACGIDRVFLAYNAEDARKIIAERKADVILCDIEMPREDGISLIRWVKEQQLKAECIFLTCHANFEYAKEAVSLGCSNYVLMPARAEEIRQTVTKAVERICERQKNEQLAQYGAQWMKRKRQEVIEKQGDKKSRAEIVGECVDYIAKNLKKPELSANVLAEACHLNAIYLNRIFKKEKNLSIGQYIIQERMNLAARLLEDAEVTPTSAAAAVGYFNYPYFSTYFKKYFGCSPQKYQEERLKEKV